MEHEHISELYRDEMNDALWIMATGQRSNPQRWRPLSERLRPKEHETMTGAEIGEEMKNKLRALME